MGVIVILFEFSYGVRFSYDLSLTNFPKCIPGGDNQFPEYFGLDLLCIFDGLSFFALLLFHYKNSSE